MPRLPECEFSDATKLEALKRAGWCCERCGIPKKETIEGYLEIHHVLGIALACELYPELSHTLIASIANARVLCKKCHLIEDRESKKFHSINARRLEGYPVQESLPLVYA